MANYEKFNKKIVLDRIEQTTGNNCFVPHSAKACPTVEALELIGVEGMDYILSEVKRLTKARIEFVINWGTENLLDTINHLTFNHLELDKVINVEIIVDGDDGWDNCSEGIKEIYQLKDTDELAFPETFQDGNIIVSVKDVYVPPSLMKNKIVQSYESHIRQMYPKKYQGYFLPKQNK